MRFTKKSLIELMGLAIFTAVGYAILYTYVMTVDTQQVLIEQGRVAYEQVKFFKEYPGVIVGQLLVIGGIGIGIIKAFKKLFDHMHRKNRATDSLK